MRYLGVAVVVLVVAGIGVSAAVLLSSGIGPEPMTVEEQIPNDRFL